ncbi:Tudor domain-containing protein 12 [Camponotus floridanus]|uniref:RNA helicase n=1 Tax=Camponotus floridanus TaxID=104421 RepID=E2B0G9_CAMFO|nr:Tudor domain-containing protein 12 [Camponotus floridanus]
MPDIEKSASGYNGKETSQASLLQSNRSLQIQKIIKFLNHQDVIPTTVTPIKVTTIKSPYIMRAYEIQQHTDKLDKIQRKLLSFMKTEEYLRGEYNVQNPKVGDVVIVQSSKCTVEVELPSFVCRGLIQYIKKQDEIYYILLVDHGISIKLTRDKFCIVPQNFIPEKYLTKAVGVFNIMPIRMKKNVSNGSNNSKSTPIEKVLIQSTMNCGILNDVRDLGYPHGIHKGWNEYYKSSRPRKLQSYIWPAINNGLNVVAIGPSQCGKTSGCVMSVCGLVAMRQKEVSHSATRPLALILCSSSSEVINIHSLCMSFLRSFDNVKSVAAFNGKTSISIARIAVTLEKDKKEYAICDNVKSFGFCHEKNVCVFRHYMLPKIDAPMTNIQIKVCISTNVGDICALEESMDTFKRVQIVRIRYDKDSSEDKVKFVDVRCIDSGVIHEAIDVYKLMHIPEELSNLPTHIVEIFLAGVAPPDKEYMWNHCANEAVHKWFSKNFDERSYIIGKVCLHLGNTIWLDDLRIGTKLLGYSDMIGSSLKKELLAKNFAILNDNHMPDLFKLCKNSDMIDINGHDINVMCK